CPPPTITRNRQKVSDLATIVDVQGNETVPDEEVETYIVGNPPYIGARKMNATQKSELRRVADRYDTKWNNLDYVAGWFICAMEYGSAIPKTAFAFVATNSLCQGQQVPTLWPLLLDDGLAIRFAY